MVHVVISVKIQYLQYKQSHFEDEAQSKFGEKVGQNRSCFHI